MIVLSPADGSEDGLAELFASATRYWELSGESPEEVFPTAPGCEALVAHDADGRLVAFAELLLAHPRTGLPWIGLLIVDASRRRSGLGRAVAEAIEDRFRSDGREALELAVLENSPDALRFWTALGFVETDRRRDVDRHRPCIVMRKAL